MFYIRGWSQDEWGECVDRVIVKVRGEQTDAEGEKSRIEMMAEGRHFYRNGKHYVLYQDQVMDGDGQISTVLKIAPDSLVLMRSGSVVQEQRFDKGQESVSEYQTPFGSLQMAVRTDEMSIVYGTVSGQVDVSYALSINGQVQTLNELHIEIRAAEGEIGRLN